MSRPIPFSEPPYLCGLPSPYYTPSHLRWQKACRAFITENLHQHALEWERDEIVPPHVFQKFAEANMLIPSLTAPLPVPWLKRLGIHDILGVVKVEEWDYIHTAIFCDEMSRSGLVGPGASLTTGSKALFRFMSSFLGLLLERLCCKSNCPFYHPPHVILFQFLASNGDADSGMCQWRLVYLLC